MIQDKQARVRDLVHAESITYKCINQVRWLKKMSASDIDDRIHCSGVYKKSVKKVVMTWHTLGKRGEMQNKRIPYTVQRRQIVNHLTYN